MNKRNNKSIAPFDYFVKPLIALSATSGGISVISFSSVNGPPAGIASASFTYVFSLVTGIIKKRRDIIRLLCLLEVN